MYVCRKLYYAKQWSIGIDHMRFFVLVLDVQQIIADSVFSSNFNFFPVVVDYHQNVRSYL